MGKRDANSMKKSIRKSKTKAFNNTGEDLRDGQLFVPKGPKSFFTESNGNANSSFNGRTKLKKLKTKRLEKRKEANKNTKNVKSTGTLTLFPNQRSNKKQKLKSKDCLSISRESSIAQGKERFAWLIDPTNIKEFFNFFWEKKPLHISRKKSSFYSALITSAAFDSMLREHSIQYTKNLDITSYRNNQRETHNPEGRATPAQVWEAYGDGCSIRLLNPQTFHQPVFELCAILQEYFGCFVGTNMYLTPPGTQGFAPHYDDIEAFVVQLEGKKRWRLYSPREESEELPRFSSGNLHDQDIGKAIMDVVLEAGDLLYFPRGTIHQANALPDSHSLHLTVSCYQKNSWGDFLLKLLPGALDIALEEDVDFRRGLPLDYMQFVGVAHSEIDSQKRADFIAKLKTLTDKLFGFAPIDAAADQMAKEFMHDSLPPNLSSDELERTSLKNCTKIESGRLQSVAPLGLDSKIKFLRANVVRLVSEEEVVRLYYSLENSKEYHEEDPKFIEVCPEEAEVIETLLHNYPAFTKIEHVPLDTDEEKLQIANILWKKGLVMTETPLEELK